jgi:hypothetical protein
MTNKQANTETNFQHSNVEKLFESFEFKTVHKQTSTLFSRAVTLLGLLGTSQRFLET